MHNVPWHHTSRAAQNEIVKKAEESYGRPWEEIENLPESERAQIEVIVKRFRPGRRHAPETLLATWKGYEHDVGQELPLNLSTASLHGTKFLREFEKKKSTWMKRKKSTQAKKGGLKKAAQERRQHG